MGPYWNGKIRLGTPAIWPVGTSGPITDKQKWKIFQKNSYPMSQWIVISFYFSPYNLNWSSKLSNFSSFCHLTNQISTPHSMLSLVLCRLIQKIMFFLVLCGHTGRVRLVKNNPPPEFVILLFHIHISRKVSLLKTIFSDMDKSLELSENHRYTEIF